MPSLFSQPKSKIAKYSAACATFLMISSLAACNSPETSVPPLYDWGSYETQLYHHFDNASQPTEQIAALEKDEQNAKAKGQHLPPGFYAQLGLLYKETGQIDKARAAFGEEEKLYPDSIPYMNQMLQTIPPQENMTTSEDTPQNESSQHNIGKNKGGSHHA